MRKSKQSAESPEFFADRNLGKMVPAQLVGLLWRVNLISDHFPDDAQAITDEDWIEYGCERGWTPLSKDSRIHGRPAERRPARGVCGHPVFP
jgi:hypothetical protein